MPKKQKANKVKTTNNVSSKKKETLIENKNTNIISDTLISNDKEINNNNTNKKFALDKDNIMTNKNEELTDYDLLLDLPNKNNQLKNNSININSKKNKLKKELIIEEKRTQDIIKTIKSKEKEMCIKNTLNNLTGNNSYEYIITALEMTANKYKNRFQPLIEKTFGTILTTGGYGLVNNLSAYISEEMTEQITDLSNKAKNTIGYNNYQQTREFELGVCLEQLKNKELTPIEVFMRITSHSSNWNDRSFNAQLINSCKLINSCINNGFPVNYAHHLRSRFSGFSSEESKKIRETILLNNMNKSNKNSNLYTKSQLMLEHQNTVEESLKTFNIDNN
ncbi:hypothetical protein [Piscirickettsia salmonis]|uniref:hypothetical protein n=1 Tax=Piscirickettsia salmonis TaxID=1238 RepID=UPI0007C94750|nr:hypothetical protein A0O36_01097 [Piscirickettsiaceae bacterium NZ-RLO1]